MNRELLILAYWCLWRYGSADGWTAADLDASVELYLDRYADLAFFCRGNAALTQLQKLRLVELAGERFRVVPPSQACEILHDSQQKRIETSL